MDFLQRQIGHWTTKTFPHRTERTIAAHTLSEATELYMLTGGTAAEALQIVLKATRKSPKPDISLDAQIAEEAADVTMLCLDMGEYKTFSLYGEVYNKLRANLRREWGERNEFGFTEHKPEERLAGKTEGEKDA